MKSWFLSPFRKLDLRIKSRISQVYITENIEKFLLDNPQLPWWSSVVILTKLLQGNKSAVFSQSEWYHSGSNFKQNPATKNSITILNNGRRASEISGWGCSQWEETSAADFGLKWDSVSFLSDYLYWITFQFKFDRIETEDEFKSTMEKIPDYRIREEDVSFDNQLIMTWYIVNQDRETDDAVKNLCSTMRHHRLTKKQLYTQAAIYAKPCTEWV